MSINYDPDARPNVPLEVFAEADELGLKVVHVICDEPGAKVGDPTGVSFAAMVSFLPRAGDRIEIAGGTMCEVKRVYFKLVQNNNQAGRTKSIHLVPTVLAQKVK